jgi:hypothetical protein
MLAKTRRALIVAFGAATVFYAIEIVPALAYSVGSGAG